MKILKALIILLFSALCVATADVPTNAETMHVEIAKLNALQSETNSITVRDAYELFFQRFEPPSADSGMSRDYAEHAYRFHQILLAVGNSEKAATILHLAIRANVDPHFNRRISVELTELYVKIAKDAEDDKRREYLGKARALLESMLW